MTPQYVGVSVAAEILGWDRRKVSVYAGRGLLPQPLTRRQVESLGLAGLRPGTVWHREDIVGHAVELTLGTLHADKIRATYGLDGDVPLGAQLVARGLLSREQGQWVDAHV